MIKVWFSQDKEFYSEMGAFFADKDIAKELDGQMYNTKDATWIYCKFNDEIYGFISLMHGTKYDLLDNFYVLKQHRSRGIGTDMLNNILKYARKDVKLITGNPIAIKMYEHVGFKVESQRGRFYKMKKEIDKHGKTRPPEN